MQREQWRPPALLLYSRWRPAAAATTTGVAKRRRGDGDVARERRRARTSPGHGSRAQHTADVGWNHRQVKSIPAGETMHYIQSATPAAATTAASARAAARAIGWELITVKPTPVSFKGGMGCCAEGPTPDAIISTYVATGDYVSEFKRLWGLEA